MSGDILHLSEFAGWLVALEKLNETLLSKASLDTFERYVSVKTKPETYQRVSIKVDI